MVDYNPLSTDCGFLLSGWLILTHTLPQYKGTDLFRKTKSVKVFFEKIF